MNTIIKAETLGSYIQVVKNDLYSKVQDNKDDDYKNVYFIKESDALVVFNEKLETIIK